MGALSIAGPGGRSWVHWVTKVLTATFTEDSVHKERSRRVPGEPLALTAGKEWEWRPGELGANGGFFFTFCNFTLCTFALVEFYRNSEKEFVYQKEKLSCMQEVLSEQASLSSLKHR